MNFECEKDENGTSIRPKEVFKIGMGNDILCLILNPQIAKNLINILNKEASKRDTNTEFTLSLSGSVIRIK